jgi:hypothetical protein
MPLRVTNNRATGMSFSAADRLRADLLIAVVAWLRRLPHNHPSKARAATGSAVKLEIREAG